MGTLWQDVRYALRTFRNNLGFTIAAIFALALSIGANTAMFSAVNAVLLNSRPLASLPDPNRLMIVWEKNPRLSSFLAQRVPVCLENFLEWKKQSRSFDTLAVYRDTKVNLTSAGDARGRRPELVTAGTASADFLPLLGTRPRVGRNFKVEETQGGSSKVVILSDELWKSRFSSDPQIVGKSLRVDGAQFEVVGVLPAGFELPALWEGQAWEKPKLWMPANLKPERDEAKQRMFFVFGHLKAGISRERAQAEMDVIGQRLQRADTELNSGFGVNVFPVSAEDVSPQLRRSLLVLQIAVLFVLLIACANVANLLLTRAVQREKEIAVRIALGAARARIVRQTLTESLLLSFFGGVVGLLLCFAALRVVSALAPADTHGFHELRLDPLVLGFTISVSMAAGLLFGMAPSFHATRKNVSEALGHGARAVGGTSNRLRGALVVCEVALSLVLLVGAGLMIRSLNRLMSTDMGFRTDHLLVLQISLPGSKYPKQEQVGVFNARLLEGVRRLPGVNAATLTDALPMRTISQATYAVDGRTTKPGQEPITDIAHVQDGYFEVLRERLYRGRTFDGHDVREAQPVALVNQAFARENWPDEDAIGKGVYLPDPNGKRTRYSIIGIVSDEHQFGPDAEIHSEVYLPWPALSSPILVVRTKGDPLTMASAVESQLWEIDKEQPISQVDSMESMLHQWTAPRRFNTTVLLSFAAVALLLAAVGLYSVLAYSVGLRTREIGVRVALGAEPKNIIRLIVGQGFLLLALGTAIGLAGAFSLTRFLESLVFGVSTVDPATFMIVAAVLIAVGALASYLPARRAARIDPMGALRAE